MPPQELFVHLAERLIEKAEAQPITITYRFADGERTYEVKPGDSLYKRLSRRRSEALWASSAKLRGKEGKL